MIRNGEKAPSFELVDQNDSKISSGGLFSKSAVVCFHRGAFCPTTDRFLTTYQDFYGRLTELSMSLAFISCDPSEESKVLAERLKIKFPILSDPDAHIGKQYGVYMSDNPRRTFYEPALFITDVNGAVAYSVISSGPKGLPGPGEIAPILLFMHTHGGKY